MRLALYLLAFVVLLQAAMAAKGDVSIAYGYVFLNISNEPPVLISLSLEPEQMYEDSPAVCSPVSTDLERNTVTYEYQWLVNSRELDVKAGALSPEHFSAGDTVICEAVPSDAYGTGASGRVSGIIQPVPLQTRLVKGTLALAGVQRTAKELSPVVERGMAATTGFVVQEIGQSTAAPIGLLAVVVGVLILVNANLLIRLRRSV
jgi:hypothetical protein